MTTLIQGLTKDKKDIQERSKNIRNISLVAGMILALANIAFTLIGADYVKENQFLLIFFSMDVLCQILAVIIIPVYLFLQTKSLPTAKKSFLKGFALLNTPWALLLLWTLVTN